MAITQDTEYRVKLTADNDAFDSSMESSGAISADVANKIQIAGMASEQASSKISSSLSVLARAGELVGNIGHTLSGFDKIVSHAGAMMGVLQTGLVELFSYNFQIILQLADSTWHLILGYAQLTTAVAMAAVQLGAVHAAVTAAKDTWLYYKNVMMEVHDWSDRVTVKLKQMGLAAAANSHLKTAVPSGAASANTAGVAVAQAVEKAWTKTIAVIHAGLSEGFFKSVFDTILRLASFFLQSLVKYTFANLDTVMTLMVKMQKLNMQALEMAFNAVKTNFGTAINAMKSNWDGFTSSFGPSSAGAAQVNFFRQQLLNLQYVFELMTKKMKLSTIDMVPDMSAGIFKMKQAFGQPVWDQIKVWASAAAAATSIAWGKVAAYVKGIFDPAAFKAPFAALDAMIAAVAGRAKSFMDTISNLRNKSNVINMAPNASNVFESKMPTGMAAVAPDLSIWEKLKAMASAAADLAGIAWAKTASFVKSAFSIDTFKSFWAALVSGFNLVTSSAGKFISSLVDGFLDVKNSAITFKSIFSAISSFANQAQDAFAKWGINLKSILALGGLVAARFLGLGVIMETVGGSIENVGFKLFNAFDAFIPEALAMQDNLVKLGRTVKEMNFDNDKTTLGFEEWQAEIEHVRAGTALFTGDLDEMAEKVMRLGKLFSLSGDQQREMIETMADMVTVGGKQSDIIDAFALALTGSDDGLRKFGITIDEEVMNHSAFATALGKTTVQMTAAEKAAAALNVVHDQTSKMLGLVIRGELTYNETLEKTAHLQKEWDAQLADSLTGPARLYAEGQLKYMESLHAIPPALVNAGAAVVSYSGALLIGIGWLTKYSVALVMVANGYNILQTIITRTTSQGLINDFFSVLNKSVNASTIPAKNLSDIFKNLGLTFLGVYKQAGGLLVQGFNGIGSAVAGLTMTVLRNPLFIQGAVIAASIVLVYNVLEPFKKEIMELIEATPTWLKWIIGVTTALATMAVVLRTSIVAQTAFMAGTRVLTLALGVNTVAINTVGEAFIALRLGMMAMATKSLPVLWASLQAATAAVWEFTAAILNNPLFITAALLAASIVMVAVAVEQLRSELPFLKDSMEKTDKAIDDASKKLDIFGTILQKVKEFGLSVFRFEIDAVKIALLLLLDEITRAQLSFSLIRTMFTKAGADHDELAAANERLSKRLQQTDETMLKTLGHMGNIAGLSAQAADSMNGLDAATKEYNNTLKNAAVLNTVLDKHKKSADFAKLTWEAFGNEFDKAKFKATEAKAVYDKMFKDFDVDATGAAEDLKKIVEGFDAMTKSALEAKKLQNDTLDKMLEASDKAHIAELKHSGQMIAAINLETAARLALHDKQIAGAAAVGKLSPEQHGIADEERLYIIREGAAEKAAERAKEAEKALKAQADMTAKLIGMDKIVDDGKLSQLKRSGQVEAALALENDMRLKNFQKQVDEINTIGKIDIESANRIAAAKLTIEADNIAQIVELRKKAADDGRTLSQSITDDDIQSIQHRLEDTTAALDRAAARDLDHWQQYQDAKVVAAQKAEDEIEEKMTLGQKVSRAIEYTSQVKGEDFTNTGAALQNVATTGASMLQDFYTNFSKTWHDAINDGPIPPSILAFKGSLEGLQKAAEPIAKAAKAIYSALKEAFLQGVEILSNAVDLLVNNVLNGAWISQLAAMFQQLNDLPMQMLQAFNQLGAVINQLATQLPHMINTLLAQLPVILQKIMDALPQVFSNIAAALPMIARAFVDALPKLIGGILDQLPKLVDGLADAMIILISKLPEIIGRILQSLPSIILSIFKAIGSIVTEFIKVFPQIIVEIVAHMSDIVEAFVQGIIAAMGTIVVALIDELFLSGGLEKLVGAMLRAIPAIIEGVIIGIIRGLKSVMASFADLLSGKGFKMPTELAQLPDQLAAAAKKVVNQVKGSSSELFKVEDYKGIGSSQTAGEQMQAAIANATSGAVARIAGIWQQLGGFVSRAWAGLIDWFTNKFGAAVGAAWHVLTDWFENKFGAIVGAAWHQIIDWFENKLGAAVAGAWKAVYDWFSNTLGYALGQAWQGVFNWFNNTLGYALGSAWQGVFNWFNNTLGSALGDAWKTVFSTLANAGQSIVNGIVGGMQSALQFFRDIGGKIWEGLWSGISGAIDRIKAVFTINLPGAAGGSGVADQLGKLLPMHLSGGGLLKTAAYASEGMVFKPNGADVIPIMGKPGEGILTPGGVRALGGEAGVRAVNNGDVRALGGQSTINLSITINTTQPVDEAFIRNRIGPAVQEMLRKNSVQGKFVLSTAGTRTTR